MSRLNPLSEIEAPLLRLEAAIGDLDEQLAALPRIEREIADGFKRNYEMLARMVELLEQQNVAAAVPASGNGAGRRAAKR